MPSDPIADAASVILLRKGAAGAQVLMGQRGAGAVFMPSKFVFPGGRVDDADCASPAPDVISPLCRAALQAQPRSCAGMGDMSNALITAALRELAEETGIILARPHPRALRFAFRAITPQGPPRRFDARFFIADMDDFAGDSDEFSAASGELSALQWLGLPQARALDLPFITRVILAEVEAGLGALDGLHDAPLSAGVPFFDNSGPLPVFLRL